MRRYAMAILRLTLCLAAAAARPCAAQDLGAIEGLFQDVSAVTVYLQGGGVLGSDDVEGSRLHGAGTEVLIDLKAGDAWDLELGLGASFLRGYDELDKTLDLRTSLRAFPTVTLYATPWSFGNASIYTGVSFGLVELWNAQAYDAAGHPWDIEGRTFEYGVSTGLYLAPGRGIGVFAETGLRQREFGSVKWTIPDDATLPEGWRSLDFSGYYVQMGVQLRMDGKNEDENDEITPAAPAGTWTLERIDGAAPPVTIDSTAAGRTQVLHAVLRLGPVTDSTSTYAIDVNVRRIAEDRQVTLDSLHETGSYEHGKVDSIEHVLTFTPDDSGRAQRAERLAGRLYVTWGGHVLVFAPGNAPPE